MAVRGNWRIFAPIRHFILESFSIDQAEGQDAKKLAALEASIDTLQLVLLSDALLTNQRQLEHR